MNEFSERVFYESVVCAIPKIYTAWSSSLFSLINFSEHNMTAPAPSELGQH